MQVVSSVCELPLDLSAVPSDDSVPAAATSEVGFRLEALTGLVLFDHEGSGSTIFGMIPVIC